MAFFRASRKNTYFTNPVSTSSSSSFTFKISVRVMEDCGSIPLLTLYDAGTGVTYNLNISCTGGSWSFDTIDDVFYSS